MEQEEQESQQEQVEDVLFLKSEGILHIQVPLLILQEYEEQQEEDKEQVEEVEEEHSMFFIKVH